MTIISSGLTIEWKLPPFLDASAIDEWVKQLPPRTERVVVHLGSWKRVGPFADARLQGALCLLHRLGVRTSAIVPPITLTGSRATAAFSDPNPQGDYQPLTPTERRLAGSVAGLSIGQLCTFDEHHNNIPVLQRETLKRRNYLYGWGNELALCVPVESIPTGNPPKTAPTRESNFNNRLLELLKPLGIQPLYPPDWFQDLKTFAFEACENTQDHGQLDLNSRPIRSIRFVRLRRIQVGMARTDLTKIGPDHEDQFSHYIKALFAASGRDLADRWGTRPLWSTKGGWLVEVTIADGGVGVSAKMAGDLAVYSGSIETEKKYLLAALLPGGSTKRPSEPGRGQGFRKMFQSCLRRSGLILVRSGRLSFSRTYRRLDGSNEPFDFKDPDSKSYIPTINQHKHPLIAGTSVSMIFPIPSLNNVY